MSYASGGKTCGRLRSGEVEALQVEGGPGETIVKLAEREDFILIVMGATGYRDVAHLLARLGSVSEYVIKTAP